MNLLLVDDEEYVVESITKNVEWESRGIDEIYTAFSMKQAQRIMEMVPVDVIISDIVMPQESGFDFIEWVREKKYEVQVIFLTSYAEFDYARRAISLESVDYLLKPIDYEKLTEAVHTAVKKAAQARQYEDYRSKSKYWHENQSLLRKDFWAEILKGVIPAEHFESEAEKRHFLYKENDEFFLLYLFFYDGRANQEIWDERTLNFIVGNVLSEILEEIAITVETVVPVEKGSCVVVCRRIDSQSLSAGEWKERGVFEKFTEWLEEKIQIDIWCGVGNPGTMDTLRNSLASIRGMRENSLSVWNRVLYLSDFEYPAAAVPNPNLQVWRALLEQGKEQELIRSMEIYLEDMERKELITREFLKVFQMDIAQMVYSWLENKGIKAHLLFSGEAEETYFRNALKGMYGAKEYARNLVSRAIQYETYIHKTESVTEQIRQYIDAHYKEEIRRDDLSEMVFLNTDYMSRIFKKEVGVSISSYILQKRVEEAKKLLSQSNLPINTVSIYVGYSNFSYFTKMFKENTGYSPLEYRRKFKQ